MKLYKNWAVYFLVIWAIVSLLAPFLASEATASNSGGALIPYSATSIDFEHTNSVSPLSIQNVKSLYYRHWLGTDELGRDVLAQLIHGSRTALFVGLGVVALASIVGILLGSIAGYFGDYSLKIERKVFYSYALPSPLLMIFILKIIPWNINAITYTTIAFQLLSGLFIYAITVFILSRIIFKSTKKFCVPVDSMVSRIIEWIDAIPLLFILIGLAAIIEPSLSGTIIIIASVAWPSIARYTRGEIIKLKNENYIESSFAIGLNRTQIIVKHILPNALGPVLVSLSFGLAGAILTEASLSFLGVGISAEQASWGKLMAEARNNYEAWWLAIFPGMAIFVTILASQKISKLFYNKG